MCNNRSHDDDDDYDDNDNDDVEQKPSTRALSAEQKMPRMSSNDVTPTCVIFLFSSSSRAVVFTDV